MSSRKVSRRDVQSAGRRATRHAVGLEQAEAALVEHYARLVCLAYLVLPPSLGRHRRVLTAHTLAQRALPRGKPGKDVPPVPTQRHGGPTADPSYAYVRQRVLRAALRVQRAGTTRQRTRRLSQYARLLPQVWGLRLFPRCGECEEIVLDQALSGVNAPARAAYALRRLEGLPDSGVRNLLTAVELSEHQIRAALHTADSLPVSAPLPDPCSVQARPTDLLRRRQYARAALFGGAALALTAGTMVLLPGGWGPDGAAAPPYTQNAAAEAALDPTRLHQVPESAWQRSTRTDFSVWPARGSATTDTALLRRALAVWARPGDKVVVSATPGTQTGPPPGPAQLLYAGEVGGASVVLLYDGLRLVRYAEPVGAEDGGAGLDFARVDGADLAASSAVVLSRSDGNTRYLTAPWVRDVATVDLLAGAATKAAEPAELAIGDDGTTDPVRTAAGSGSQHACTNYPVLEVSADGAAEPFTLADMGELAPAQLTYGPPDGQPVAASSAPARDHWARLACNLPSAGTGGVRSVNAWHFAEQRLPDRGGTAHWICTRAETWRGSASRAQAQFLPPASPEHEHGTVTAQTDDTLPCSARDPRVLSGVLWKSPRNAWHLLAATSENATITATGGVEATKPGPTMAIPAEQRTQATLTAKLPDGTTLPMLR